MNPSDRPLEGDMRFDHRRNAAQVLAHLVLAEIRDLLPRDIEGDVHDRIACALYRNGVLIVRDEERAALGLERCDQKGWTASEKVQLEQDRLAVMTQIDLLKPSPYSGEYLRYMDESLRQMRQITGIEDAALGRKGKS